MHPSKLFHLALGTVPRLCPLFSHPPSSQVTPFTCFKPPFSVFAWLEYVLETNNASYLHRWRTESRLWVCVETSLLCKGEAYMCCSTYLPLLVKQRCQAILSPKKHKNWAALIGWRCLQCCCFKSVPCGWYITHAALKCKRKIDDEWQSTSFKEKIFPTFEKSPK